MKHLRHFSVRGPVISAVLCLAACGRTGLLVDFGPSALGAGAGGEGGAGGGGGGGAGAGGDGGSTSPGSCLPGSALSEATVVAQNEPGKVWDLVVDADALYWSADQIRTALKSGSAAKTLSAAKVFAMTADAIHLYGVGQTGLLRISKNGGAIEEVALGHWHSIAVDESSVYLTVLGFAGEVVRLPKAVPGSTPEVIASVQPGAQGLAVDAGDVFWANYKTGDIMVRRAGSTIPELLATGPTGAREVAVNAKHVFWTVDANPSSVRRVNRDGTNPIVIADDPCRASSVELDASHVYWTNHSGVMRAPHDGGTIETVALNPGTVEMPHGLALDANTIYWTYFEGGPVLRAPKP